MRIVHVITGLGDGGAQRALYGLCANDKVNYHTVVSLTPPDKYSKLLQLAGICVHHLDLARQGVNGRGALKLYRLLRRDRVDVVQTWMYHADMFGGLVARLAGCHTVIWNIRHTELGSGGTGRATRLLAWACARLSHLLPSKIIACAERARQVHVDLGYDPSKFVVIPNGYDTATFCPDSESRDRIRQSLSIAPNTLLLGVVGRWNPQKDHFTMLRAMAELGKHWPHARLLLVGTGCGRDNSELTACIDAHGLREHVTLLGSRDDIPAIMNALDLLVLSSSHGEGFPNVVAEAMACGTPCVVTDVGDAASIVSDTGWVVSPHDSGALAQAITAALTERTNADKWSQRQTSARQRIVDTFSLEAMIARYREVWASASTKD